MLADHFPGMTVEQFAVANQGRRFGSASRAADHDAALTSQMQGAIGSSIDQQKVGIIGIFPVLAKKVISFCWANMVRLGEFVAGMAIDALIAYWSTKTIEEFLEWFAGRAVKAKARRENSNPYPVGVVSPE